MILNLLSGTDNRSFTRKLLLSYNGLEAVTNTEVNHLIVHFVIIFECIKLIDESNLITCIELEAVAKLITYQRS